MEAGVACDAARLIEASVQTVRAMSWDAAAKLGRAAWAAQPTWQTGMLLGLVLLRIGRYEEADTVFAATGQLAADDVQRVDVAGRRAEALHRGLARPEQARQALADARALVTDANALAELAVADATIDLYEGRNRAALEAVAPLLDGPTQRCVPRCLVRQRLRPDLRRSDRHRTAPRHRGSRTAPGRVGSRRAARPAGRAPDRHRASAASKPAPSARRSGIVAAEHERGGSARRSADGRAVHVDDGAPPARSRAGWRRRPVCSATRPTTGSARSDSDFLSPSWSSLCRLPAIWKVLAPRPERCRRDPVSVRGGLVARR